jgi:lipopolysaccharide/colanic/teichoic acid biosynthesis glycosyltransferase
MRALVLRPSVSPAAPEQNSARAIAFPRLLDERLQRLKRVLDVAWALMLGVVAIPFVVVIAALVLLTSGRPLLYGHMRVGRGRRPVRIWKFRTMVVNADEVLAGCIRTNADRALEWQTTHKLKNDPRVTWIGRFLRRTSLDELPQIWNILRGEMSMVGPRPIVEEEVPKYGSAFQLYVSVRPGLTGLWQVSGRSDTSYRRRAELDSEYIREWKVSTDLRLLARTVRAIVVGKGAY